MLKAMLVVTALGGGGDYTAEMPSMEECLDARIVIAEQDLPTPVLCIKRRPLYGVLGDIKFRSKF